MEGAVNPRRLVQRFLSSSAGLIVDGLIEFERHNLKITAIAGEPEGPGQDDQ